MEFEIYWLSLSFLGEGIEGEIELDYDLDYQVDDQDITSHHSDVGDQGVQEDVNEEKNEVILYNVTSEEALKFFLSWKVNKYAWFVYLIFLCAWSHLNLQEKYFNSQ